MIIDPPFEDGGAHVSVTVGVSADWVLFDDVLPALASGVTDTKTAIAIATTARKGMDLRNGVPGAWLCIR